MKSIRLLKLELHSYALLNLSGIQTITIDFKDRFHWILGTNGSGKTSIIKESTPLSPNPSNYRDGGYKRSLWQVDDIIYELTSTKLNDKKSVHSFCIVKSPIDKEELNPGHTSTVFRGLVQERFGITKESHLVSTGKLRLTEMDPGARKTLFTNLSSIDYTYALGYYKRLYTSYRDILGSLKIDQGRLVELKASSFSGDEEKTCLEEIKVLKKQVESLINIRPNVSEPESVVKQNIEKTKKSIQGLYDRVMTLSVKNKKLYPLDSEENLRLTLARLEASFQHKENAIDDIYRKFEESTKKREGMLAGYKHSQPELVDILEKHKAFIKGLKYAYITELVDAHHALNHIDRAQSEFTPVKESMFVMDPEEASEIDKVAFQLKGLQDLLHSKHDRVSVVVRELESIRKHEHDPSVTCPKCDHSFNPIFTENRARGLQTLLDEANKELAEVTIKFNEVDSQIMRMKAYHFGQTNFHNYIRKYPIYNDLWSYVIHEKLNSLDPFSIDHHFDMFRMELRKKIEEQKARDEIVETTKKLEWLNKVAEDDLRKIEEDIKDLEKTLNRLHSERSEDLSTLSSVKEQVSLWTFFRTSGEEAKSLKDQLELWIRKDYDHMERSELSDFIRKLDMEITTRELKLRQIHSKSTEIIRLESMITQSGLKTKALKDALKVLSPSEGLIAKGLTGFINHFTGLMNGIISRIMTYDMIIPPLVPSDDKFELDFDIPIDIVGTRAKDISDCSKGQAEIIDLAFRILYLKFTGLEGGPLFLDEFGTHLDFKHQHKAFEAVRQMLDITNFSQILMVSHMSNTYGLMDGAGVTVLCPSNVDIPDGVAYNGTTEIKRI